MKIKKMFVTILAAGMVFGLAACGGDNAPAPTTQAATAAATTKDQLAEQQALADADYEQMMGIVQGLNDHIGMNDQITAIRQEVIDGKKEESALLDALKQLSDDSQNLLGQVQAAQWKTEYYKEHIALLTETVEALAQGELLSYQAGAENDETKADKAVEFLKTYETKLDEFLTLLGA